MQLSMHSMLCYVAWQRGIEVGCDAKILNIIKMGVDYYKILSLTRSATDADIKKA